jgi:hypothetical protein
MLTSFGDPVFRRCRREWVDGARVGVSFKKTNIGIKSSEEVQRKDSGAEQTGLKAAPDVKS